MVATIAGFVAYVTRSFERKLHEYNWKTKEQA
jgi:hypothetical protein